MILLFIVILLFVCYSVLIFYYWQSWKAMPVYTRTGRVPAVSISVIIPARNEEENIERLLIALQEQTYPKELLEIIVIDDHSTDKTAEIVRQFPAIKLLQLSNNHINSYKKKAIETGIESARGQLIITTDADCWCGEYWLQTMASFYEEKKPVFIAAPVSIDCSSHIVEVFQAFDFAILQGITGAAVSQNIHSMCNGANLAYEKKAFYEVGGFGGIDSIASGDDMLLMHKIWKRYPRQVYYLKTQEAIVTTQAQKTWKSFFNQRIRWASKATQYNDKRITAVLFLVYFFNLSFLALLLFGFWDYRYWLYLTGLWVAKTLVEFPFTRSVASFFNKQYLVKYFFFFQPLHIAYTIVSGFFGQFGKYEWKGRKLR